MMFVIVTATFPKKYQGLGLSIITTSVALGMMITPFIGGILLDNYGWRFAFRIIGFIGIITVVTPRPGPHRDRGDGLAISVGGLKPLDASGLRWTFITLSHNLVRGAAGGAILTAEDAHRRGLLGHSANR